MSAIYGAYRWDGGIPDPDEIAALGEALQHRGERPPRIWSNGPVTLGHCMLPTTPEALHETLPLHGPAHGCTITADARIDNREELISQLGISGPPAVIPDSTLILAAYARWGETCPEHLLGDFAFVIWDEKRQQLFCARDQFGVKPLYYATDDEGLVFASEIGALFSFESVSREVNPSMIAAHLAGLLDEANDTFYTGVSRVQPAHSLLIVEGKLVSRRYYRLDPSINSSLRNDQEYAEAFREIFRRAVSRRLRSPRPLACMLSGGLDSSSVASIAQGLLPSTDLPLTTLSSVFPGKPCDESPFIEAVLRTGEYRSYRYPVKDTHSVGDLIRFVVGMGQPTVGLGQFTMGSLYEQARDLGHNVILNGHGGDEVVSLGYARLRELALTRQWLTLTREWIALGEANGGLQLGTLAKVFFSFGLLGKISRKVSRHLPGRRRVTEGSATTNHIDSDFARSTDLVARSRKMRPIHSGIVASAREAHFNVLSNSAQSRLFEDLDRPAGRYAVEPRYPFWDREVVEFCLSLPTEQKLSRGRTRAVMRHALTGILADKVRNRLGKTDFSHHALTCLRSIGESNLDGLIDNQTGPVRPISVAWYRRAVKTLFQDDVQAKACIHSLWGSISVLIWLQQQDTTPTNRLELCTLSHTE